MEKFFTSPANVNDFAQSRNKENELREAWHKKIEGIVENLVTKTDESTGELLFPHFYNPLKVPEGTSVVSRIIPWSGFPRVVESWLNLNPHSSALEWQQAFETAEILSKVVVGVIQYYRNGNLEQSERSLFRYNLESNIANYKVSEGRIVPDSAFHVYERNQDEYLEWFVYKDEKNKVKKITFTSEGPEYWEVLAETDKQLTAELYQKYSNPNATIADLYWQETIAGPVIAYDLDSKTSQLKSFTVVYQKGEYNPYNKYNTTEGIMHLIQRNNTLGAEINLAAAATKEYPLARTQADNFRFDLCACAGYGAINRNSDPTIGDLVNSLATDNKKVTISNPIGLYIGDIQVEGIKDSEGNDYVKDDILVIERGDPNLIKPRILRFSIVAPETTPHGLEGFKLGNQNLTFGGPVAKLTSITIYGEAISTDVPNINVECSGKTCPHPTKPSYRQVEDLDKTCDSIDWDNDRPPFELPENKKMAYIEEGLMKKHSFKMLSHKDMNEPKDSLDLEIESVDFKIISKRF